MKESIRVANYLVLLISVLSCPACKSPAEPHPPVLRFFMDVRGDIPVYIEFSYEDVDHGAQAGHVTTSDTYCRYGWDGGGRVSVGSSYRLYAVSKAPNGYVYASVSTDYDVYYSTGVSVWAKSASDSGTAVEITGTVPYP